MSWWDIDLFWPLLLVSQASGVAIVSIMAYGIMKFTTDKFSWNHDGLIAFHAFMSMLGMVFLFGEGMLLFSVPRRLNLKSHFIRKVLHGVTMGAGVIFGIVGLKAIMYYKDRYNASEFFSVHSWLGMTAAMLFFFQHGVAMFFYICSRCFPQRFMIRFTDLHTFFGYVLFAMSIASCVSGFNLLENSDAEVNSGLPPINLFSGLCALLMLLFVTVVAFIASRPPPKQSKRQKTTTPSEVEVESDIISTELLVTDEHE